jgi:putative membrane protein
MQIFKTLLVVIIIILTVSFVLENKWIVDQRYEIQYYTVKSPAIPLVLLFLANILFGALLMAVPSFIKNHHLKKALKGERKKIAQMEKELSSLRNLPITEEKHIEKVDEGS